jgi:hypothetical protein
MSQKSIYAIAVSERQAVQIEENLTKAGFSNDEISALIPDKDSTPEFARNPSTKGGDGKTTSASNVGVFGEAMDLLASIGALAIPGVGRLIAAGPLFATISAFTTGAAVVGISSILVSLGIPKLAAKHYENRIAEGGILISVHAQTPGHVEKAQAVLITAHAEDIAITSIPDRIWTVS